MILKSSAQELALIAQEVGGEVIRGTVAHAGNQPADITYLVLDVA